MTFMPSRENVDLLWAAVLQQACEDYIALYSGRKKHIDSGTPKHPILESVDDLTRWFYSSEFRAIANCDPDELLAQLRYNVDHKRFRIYNPDRFNGMGENMSRKNSKGFNEKKGVYKPTAEVKS